MAAPEKDVPFIIARHTLIGKKPKQTNKKSPLSEKKKTQKQHQKMYIT